MNDQLSYDLAGAALTRGAEGERLTAYRDPRGIWTIGIGHTGPEVHEGMVITSEQSNEYLLQDIKWAEDVVKKTIKVPLNQNQYNALVDFTFNIGRSAFPKSTLAKMINAGNFADADKEFLRWDKSGGKVYLGLTKRRRAEAELFAKVQEVDKPNVSNVLSVPLSTAQPVQSLSTKGNNMSILQDIQVGIATTKAVVSGVNEIAVIANGLAPGSAIASEAQTIANELAAAVAKAEALLGKFTIPQL